MQYVNLAIRFCLELATLVIIGIWGWRASDTWLHYVLGLGLPLAAATVWGVFNVPGDPSRSGRAPVVVPGVIRLIIEILFFASGIWALSELRYGSLALWIAVLIVVHYAVSYQRVSWLLRQ